MEQQSRKQSSTQKEGIFSFSLVSSTTSTKSIQIATFSCSGSVLFLLEEFGTEKLLCWIF